MVAGLLPLALYSIFGKGMEDFGGNGWIFFGIAWNIIGQFVISHWEKYLTGVLFLPWGYDFAQLVSIRKYRKQCSVPGEFYLPLFYLYMY